MSNFAPDKQYDYHKQTSVYISDYIKFADAKAGAALTVVIVVLSFFIKDLHEHEWKRNSLASFFSDWKIYIHVFPLVILGYGLVFLLLTIWPRYKTEINSYQSWGGIAAFPSEQDYIIELTTRFQDEDLFLLDMISQNHTLAGICKTKYTKLRYGFIWSSIGIVLYGMIWFLGF